MKANELRIGNLVFLSWEKEPEYKGYRRYEFSFDLIHSVKHLHPIPLTEEWLLKFGFERKYDSNYWNSKLCIHTYYNEFYILQEQGRVFFQHVHQLQNLYFALTGEELTYTQP